METSARPGSTGRPLAAVLGVAVALVLAACGSSSTPASTPASSSAATTGTTASAGSTASTAAGSPAAATTKPLKIGFSAFNLQIPALEGVAEGLTAIGKAMGDTVLTADPKGDPSTQLQQIQQWVTLGQVDAIWVIPEAAKTLTPVIKQAQAKGIVVIASGVPSDYGFTGMQKGITFTNVDNKAFGSELGQQTAMCITQRLGGVGNVIYMSSAQGLQSTADINNDFKAALASGAPKSKIVNTQISTDRLGDQQKISSALQGNPDANVVVGTDDESTLGGLDAFTQAGKSPAKTCIVGAGGNAEAQGDVKSGKVFADVAFNFQADIAHNVKALGTLAADPASVGVQLTTPIQVITK
jgi:ABC-type sugar transport system substrate-binding protein